MYINYVTYCYSAKYIMLQLLFDFVQFSIHGYFFLILSEHIFFSSFKLCKFLNNQLKRMQKR